MTTAIKKVQWSGWSRDYSDRVKGDAIPEQAPLADGVSVVLAEAG